MDAEAQVQVENVGPILHQQVLVAIGAANDAWSGSQNRVFAQRNFRQSWGRTTERFDVGIEQRFQNCSLLV